ncbi:replication initiation protein [Methylibium petroleiphilum]|nr:replication initiation protein [Methylibium petroleiphilum]
MPQRGQASLFASEDEADPYKKAVEIVHALPRQGLSLLSRKVGNCLLRQVVNVGPRDDAWYEIGISPLAQMAGFDSKDFAHLKSALRALMGLVFEWDVVTPVTKRRGWEAASLFPNVKIPPGAGVVRFQVNPELLPLIVKPEVYALIDMAVVRRFRRTASLALWEHCVRFERVGATSEVPWQTLRDILLGQSADSKTYNEFKYFKAKVLAPAIREINSESNHQVEMRMNYVGRFVSTIAFTIRPKAEATDSLTPETMHIVGEMVQIGVPQGDARRLAKMYGEAKLKGALQYTRDRMADTKREPLSNPGAYFRHALHTGYARPAEIAIAPEQTTSPSEDLATQLRSHRAREAQAYYRELDADEQRQLVERYNCQQALGALQVKTKPTRAAEAAFSRWLAIDTWGEPSKEDLLEFAAQMLAAKTR